MTPALPQLYKKIFGFTTKSIDIRTKQEDISYGDRLDDAQRMTAKAASLHVYGME